MTSTKNIYFYLTTILSLLIPVSGRFVFGFYLLLLFNVQILCLTLIFHGIDKLHIGGLKEPVVIFSLIFMTVLYKQILYAVCPIAAVTLGFCIYLPAISTFTIQFFFGEKRYPLGDHLVRNMKLCGANSAMCLLLFLFRDLFGFGTLTLPGAGKIVCLHLPFYRDNAYAGAFFATIPGGLVLFAILLALYIYVSKKLDIIAHSGANV